MGKLKELLLIQQEEEQELWESYLQYCEDNKELFSQLPHPNPEEVIGYEE